MIVVSGESLLDIFAASQTAGGLMLEARVGGSPLNVAIGLARLGRRVAFFGALSSGFLGERLWRALRDEGVDTACTVRVDAPTTLGIVGVDGLGAPAYAFYGDAAADRRLSAAELARVPEHALAYHFGSYAMVVEPVASTQRALVERESARSVIAYDPNLRPQLEPDLALWRQAFAWMLPRTQLLKLSAEDLALLHPGGSADALAAAWLEAGVALVVLTRGGAGASAWTRKLRLDVEAVPAALVDTVGAGDAFQAALLARLASRSLLTPAALRALDATALRDVLGYAAGAAAVACSRRGADLPRLADLA